MGPPYKENNLNWQCHMAFLHWFGMVLLFPHALNFRENTAAVEISQNGVFIVDSNGRVIRTPQTLGVHLKNRYKFKGEFMYFLKQKTNNQLSRKNLISI